jgi:hypothetical protein
MLVTTTSQVITVAPMLVTGYILKIPGAVLSMGIPLMIIKRFMNLILQVLLDIGRWTRYLGMGLWVRFWILLGMEIMEPP